VLVKDLAGCLECGADGSGNQSVFGHPLGDRKIEAGLETEVAVRQNADQLAVGVGDRNAEILYLAITSSAR